ncbi:MAG: enoyl-CoA hydratase-related protein, partial [Myxococcota bacterium]
TTRFAATAREVAERLANGPPTALRYMKDNLNRSLDADLESVLELEAERMVDSATTDDYVEAVRAFTEGREPEFKGD